MLVLHLKMKLRGNAEILEEILKEIRGVVISETEQCDSLSHLIDQELNMMTNLVE